MAERCYAFRIVGVRVDLLRANQAPGRKRTRATTSDRSPSNACQSTPRRDQFAGPHPAPGLASGVQRRHSTDMRSGATRAPRQGPLRQGGNLRFIAAAALASSHATAVTTADCIGPHASRRSIEAREPRPVLLPRRLPLPTDASSTGKSDQKGGQSLPQVAPIRTSVHQSYGTAPYMC
jgi:hypothetical protein